jgi:RimJ/RimL family protein N-acetyltransferase
MISKQIHIRPLELFDITRTSKWLNDYDMSKIMGYLPYFNQQEQELWFNKTINDKSRFIFAICINDNNEHIGNVALGNVDYINRKAQFSIFIYDKKHRGKGYGKEATKLLLDFAFNRLNLHKVHLQTSRNFESAVKLYESLGFKLEGVLREDFFEGGIYSDKLIYSILVTEYKKNNDS